MDLYFEENMIPKLEVIRDRSKPWTLSATLGAGGIVICAYMTTIFVINFIMKNRKPLELKSTLFYYNLMQIAFSAYTALHAGKILLQNGIFPVACLSEQHYHDTQKGVFLFFIAKHLDLIDTIIFALRKKSRQITFLHVYHHAAMVLTVWWIYLCLETDHYIFPGFLNSVVHFVMYSYYFLSSLGPTFQKYIWWKKYLTKFQLVQFVLIASHQLILHQVTHCPVPRNLYYFTLSNPIVFFVLFMNFYIKNYSKVV